MDTHKYRLRLLNATATTIYTLVLVRYDSDQEKYVDKSITVIGSDSGLRQHPVLTPDLKFVMADRYEIIIDFNNHPINSRMALVNRVVKDGVTTDTPLICFEVATAINDTSVLPFLLRPSRGVNSEVASPKHGADKEFIFDFNGPTAAHCSNPSPAAINGQIWDKDQVQAYPPLKSWQKWRLINKGPAYHPIHIHLLDFQLLRRLDKDGNEVSISPYEKDAWKDVFNLGPNETLDIIGEFGPHLGKYMIHCHNLQHEDCDMMTQFEVIDPNGENKGHDPITTAPAIPLPETYQPQPQNYAVTDLCSPS